MTPQARNDMMTEHHVWLQLLMSWARVQASLSGPQSWPDLALALWKGEWGRGGGLSPGPLRSSPDPALPRRSSVPLDMRAMRGPRLRVVLRLAM